MFLTSTYFQGDLYLPLSELNPNVVGVARMRQTVAEQSLDYFITKYEHEYLHCLLGVDLYNAFLQGMARRSYSSAYSSAYGSYLNKLDANRAYNAAYSSAYGPYVGNIWLDLRDIIFQKRENYFFSPAANFVYYWVCRNAVSQTTEKGEIKFRVSDSEIVSSARKLTDAWNEMCKESNRIRAYILNNWEQYGKYADHKCVCSYVFTPINIFNL